jgi:hypothetical protein
MFAETIADAGRRDPAASPTPRPHAVDTDAMPAIRRRLREPRQPARLATVASRARTIAVPIAGCRTRPGERRRTETSLDAAVIGRRVAQIGRLDQRISA